MEVTENLELWTESGRFVLEYACDIRVREVVNGEYYASFDYLHVQDDPRYPMLAVGVELRFPDGVARGQRFKVRKVTEIRKGRRIYKAVEAHHIAFGLGQYYYDGYIDFAAAKTLPEMLALLGADTPYSFAVQGGFAAQDIFEWGEDTRYNLLQKLRQLYNAEIAFDNCEITLTPRKGANRGTTLRYNQNLIGIQRNTHDMERITRLYGYGKNGLTIEGYGGRTTKYIDSPYLEANNVYEAKAEFSEIESQAALLAEMQRHLAKYELPALSYDIDFVQLEKIDRIYETLKIVEAGDTVTVIDDILGYTFDARAIEYEYYPFEPKRGRVVLANFREMKAADYIFQATVASKKAISYTSNNAILKGVKYDDSLTLVDGLGMKVTDSSGSERVRLGQYGAGKYGLWVDGGAIEISGGLPNAQVAGASVWNAKTTLLTGTGIYTGQVTTNQIIAGTAKIGSALIDSIKASQIDVATGRITAAQIETLTVGSNVQMGPNAYITWGNVTNIPGNVYNPSYLQSTYISQTLIASPSIQGGNIAIGSGNNIFKADENGIYLGNASFSSAPFRVNMAGQVTSSDITITGGNITGAANINVTSDVRVGNKIHLNGANFGNGIDWGDSRYEIYTDPGGGSLRLKAPSGIYANNHKIDQAPVAKFG